MKENSENEIKKYSEDKYPDQELTGKIIGICMEVHRQLGHGFLEVVYQEALSHELSLKGVSSEREKKYTIAYKGITLSHFYIADFVIEGKLIVELKAQNGIIDEHYKQVINYLAASKCQCGLLINFGEASLKFRRLALTNKNNLRKS
ncbi:MAG TPA: GxxExxY protein, partial [Bacteroidia bacterium]|nr:GxxExxY protein [Bacteroidia bacterium]